tara:strand:- start:91 stop:2190 length:2100 start_codon:yes stop_codon:yes gene_type:complete
MGKFTNQGISKESNNTDVVTAEEKEKLVKDLTGADRSRLIASGLLMDFADEGEAFIESLFSGGSNLSFTERYKKNLKENQEALAEAREKEGSLKYEIGGAALPALATLPFGGVGAAPSIAKLALSGGKRLAVTGGVQGGVTAIGSGEEANILERVDDLSDIVKVGTGVTSGAILGKAGGVAGEKITQFISSFGGDSLLRLISKELGKGVEDELKRLATSSNKSVNEIVDEISKGKIIPEIDSNIADEVRAFIAKSSQGGAKLKETAIERASQKSKDVFQTAQSDLAPKTGFGNVKLFYNKSKEKLQSLEGAAYNRIFRAEGQDTANYQEIGDSILELARSRPDIGNKINRFLQDAGLGNVFEQVTDEAGVKTLQLGRNVNLEVAENVKRALMDLKESSYRTGNNQRGNIFKGLEKSLQRQIDEISPELAGTRANWASIMRGDDAFKLGQKVLGKSADDIEIEFLNVLQKMQETGDKTLLETYRLGVVSALRQKSGTATTKSFIRNLANEDTNVRAVLEKIYPDDKLDEILRKIEVADGSLMNLKKFGELSPTAETVIKAQKVGQFDQEDLTNLKNVSTSVLLSSQGIPNAGFIAPASNLIRKYVTSASKLSEKEMLQVANLLVSENPQLIETALTDVKARNTLLRKANEIAEAIISGSQRAGSVVGTQKIVDSGPVDALLNTLDDATKEKLSQIGLATQ